MKGTNANSNNFNILIATTTTITRKANCNILCNSKRSSQYAYGALTAYGKCIFKYRKYENPHRTKSERTNVYVEIVECVMQAGNASRRREKHQKTEMIISESSLYGISEHTHTVSTVCLCARKIVTDSALNTYVLVCISYVSFR